MEDAWLLEFRADKGRLVTFSSASSGFTGAKFSFKFRSLMLVQVPLPLAVFCVSSRTDPKSSVVVNSPLEMAGEPRG